MQYIPFIYTATGATSGIALNIRLISPAQTSIPENQDWTILTGNTPSDIPLVCLDSSFLLLYLDVPEEMHTGGAGARRLHPYAAADAINLWRSERARLPDLQSCSVCLHESWRVWRRDARQC